MLEKKLFRKLIYIILIEIIFLLPILSTFWIYKTKQANDEMVYKDKVNLCLLNDNFSKSNIFVCSESMKNFYLYLNPFKVNKQRKKVKREIYYWECYTEKKDSEKCSKEADEYYNDL